MKLNLAVGCSIRQSIEYGPRSILSIGWNGAHSMTLEKGSKKGHHYKHAEANAIDHALNGRKTVRKSTIYVTSLPCRSCDFALFSRC
jgi:deoxycytidylate deaminase